MHDTVAQKNFDPVLPPLPDDFEDDLEEESVKIVRLVKNKEPLVSCDVKSRVGMKLESLQEKQMKQERIMGWRPLASSANGVVTSLYSREPPSGVTKPLEQ